MNQEYVKNAKAVLLPLLELMVPEKIKEFQQNPERLAFEITRGSQYADIIAYQADTLLFPSEITTEQGGHVLSVVSKALAILSFSPGGVDFLGLHFESRIP